MKSFSTAKELIDCANKKNTTISQVVLEQQAYEQQKSQDVIYDKMKEILHVMDESQKKGFLQNTLTPSGLSGTDAKKLRDFSNSDKTLLQGYVSKAAEMAIAISEYNASMGKIVAAPTAGSAGIVPASILSLLLENEVSEHQAVMSLMTASGIGIIISTNASLAGAQGGCQAECGSACAMASAALVELRGGSPKMCCDAAAIALKNFLGLICDPVAGLVECPCVKRNVNATVVAFSSAQMALSGIVSQIPLDEVIVTMKQVGDMMPSCYKETATGGLAITPTALNIQNKLFNEA